MDVERDNGHARSRSEPPPAAAAASHRHLDLTRLLNSTACNISLGIILLLIGVVVTVMTFMEHRATNKIFLLGPILVGAGVLGVGKAVLKKYRFGDIDQRRRRRRRSRHLHRALEIRENNQTIGEVSISAERSSSNFRSNPDEPPPYNIISLLGSESALLRPPPQTLIIDNGMSETMLPKYSESDPLPPPPKYEEVVVQDSGEINVSYSTDDTCRILEAQELETEAALQQTRDSTSLS